MTKRPWSLRVVASCAVITALSIAFAPSALANHNDLRANSVFVPLSGGSSSTSGDNIATFEEVGEDISCDATDDFGATVWYRFTAPANGTAVFRVNEAGEVTGDTFSGGAIGNDNGFLDTVLAVYPVASATPLGCNDDDPAGDGVSSRLSLSVAGGATYAVQIGGYWLGDQAPPWPEEGFFNYTVDFTAAPVLQVLPLNAKADPKWAAFPTDFDKKKKRGKTGVKNFRVTGDPGTRVVLTCNKCRFNEKVFTIGGNGFINLKNLFGLLKPKTVIEIFLTKAGVAGEYYRWRIRKNDVPKEKLCPISTAGQLQC